MANETTISASYELQASTFSEVNIAKLHWELNAVVSDFVGLTSRQPGSISLVLGTEPSDTAKTALLTAVSEHDPVDMAGVKSAAVTAVHAHSEEVLSRGALHQGVRLAVTPSAQSSWTALRVAASSASYPTYVPGQNAPDFLALHSEADVDALYLSLFAHCSALSGSAHAALAAVALSTTPEAVFSAVSSYQET